MSYALIVDGAVAQYPYGLAQLRRDNPDVSFPADPDDNRLVEFGVVKVHPSDRPAHDPITENVVKAAPVLVDGQWVQGWAVEPAAAEDVAARQQRSADRATRQEVRADNFVATFVGMTPAQVAAYVENNTGNLAATRALLKKMAVMLLILARREFRDDE